VSIQPSEFMKLAMVIVLARHFARTVGRRLG
jgi:cell division protein FtsW (lipid II flippase)